MGWGIPGPESWILITAVSLSLLMLSMVSLMVICPPFSMALTGIDDDIGHGLLELACIQEHLVQRGGADQFYGHTIGFEPLIQKAQGIVHHLGGAVLFHRQFRGSGKLQEVFQNFVDLADFSGNHTDIFPAGPRTAAGTCPEKTGAF